MRNTGLKDTTSDACSDRKATPKASRHSKPRAWPIDEDESNDHLPRLAKAPKI